MASLIRSRLPGGSKVKGDLSITLRHEQRHESASIICHHMKGEAGFPSAGQSVLAGGTPLKGWVDVRLSDKAKVLLNNDETTTKTSLVIVVQSMERRDQVKFKSWSMLPLRQIHEMTCPVVDFTEASAQDSWVPTKNTHICWKSRRIVHDITTSDTSQDTSTIAFDFPIPPTAPSSNRINSEPNYDAEVHRIDEFMYVIQTALIDTNTHEILLHSKPKLFLVSGSILPTLPKPYHLDPQPLAVSRRKTIGTIRVALSIPNIRIYNNSDLHVSISCRNESPVDIKKVILKIVERAYWDDTIFRTITREKIVSGIITPGMHFGKQVVDAANGHDGILMESGATMNDVPLTEREDVAPSNTIEAATADVDMDPEPIVADESTSNTPEVFDNEQDGPVTSTPTEAPAMVPESIMPNGVNGAHNNNDDNITTTIEQDMLADLNNPVNRLSFKVSSKLKPSYQGTRFKVEIAMILTFCMGGFCRNIMMEVPLECGSNPLIVEELVPDTDSEDEGGGD